ncbi:GNAT family N-acetyltransferase [Pseudoponticoccus marisrubri]|uniref:Acetyltransferase n=1 Tax=Pseudoponticoccus marisrubri TaxID=1685382 RepID=A0A0W7WIL9_9RHOB|nr:GNAT family N-acetyltransferase [Pseudoponticoccus marisrubri]KUF10356.1 acetyltransferase [Pseudoponticoccus marisrubri]
MIRSATQDDIPALAAMLRELNALHATQVPHRFHDSGDAAGLRAFFETAFAEGARALLYVTDGVPRGYLLWRIEDRPASALEPPRRLAVLDHVHVEPIWRRRGLAGRLVARFEAESLAAGCTGWIARVHVFNASSAGLMRQAGAAPAVELFEKRLQAPSRSSSPAAMP